jgi:hypothetical protein
MVCCAGTSTGMEPDEKPDPTTDDADDATEYSDDQKPAPPTGEKPPTDIDADAPARGVLFPDEEAPEPNEPG